MTLRTCQDCGDTPIATRALCKRCQLTRAAERNRAYRASVREGQATQARTEAARISAEIDAHYARIRRDRHLGVADCCAQAAGWAARPEHGGVR